MAPKEITTRVGILAESILSNVGMELVDVEYRREGKGWVLRLFIDKDGGITLDDCSRVSQEVGRSLDVEDLILSPYTLEVSSPGLNRTLKKEGDFVKYRNHAIRVKTNTPIGIRRQFEGKLLSVSEDRIEMEVDREVVYVPLADIAKAHLMFDWGTRSFTKGRTAKK